MRTIVALAIMGLLSLNAQAAFKSGYTNVSQSGDLITFRFDRLFYDISSEDGLSFTGLGIDFSVTGSDQVIQHATAHFSGGLGVVGEDSDGRLSGGESLNFTFGGLVDIMGFTLNVSSATGDYGVFTDSGDFGLVSSQDFDGYGSEYIYQNQLADNHSVFGSVSSMTFATIPNSFYGYIDTITLRKVSVPEPLSLLLFILGLAGFIALRRSPMA